MLCAKFHFHRPILATTAPVERFVLKKCRKIGYFHNSSAIFRLFMNLFPVLDFAFGQLFTLSFLN